jgi:hypothetical protein
MILAKEVWEREMGSWGYASCVGDPVLRYLGCACGVSGASKRDGEGELWTLIPGLLQCELVYYKALSKSRFKKSCTAK